MARKDMKARPRVTLKFPVAVDENGVSPEQGGHEDEEEEAQEQGHVLVAVVADVLLRDLVPDVEDERLHRRAQPARHAFLVAADGQAHDDEDERGRDPEPEQVLAGADVQPEEVEVAVAVIHHVVHQDVGDALGMFGRPFRRLLGPFVGGRLVRDLREEGPERHRNRHYAVLAPVLPVRRDRTASSRTRNATKYERSETVSGTLGSPTMSTPTTTAPRSTVIRASMPPRTATKNALLERPVDHRARK
jgi:hypothetical protein